MNFHYPEIPHGISGWLLYLYGDVFGMDLPTGEFAGSRFEAPSYAGGEARRLQQEPFSSALEKETPCKLKTCTYDQGIMSPLLDPLSYEPVAEQRERMLAELEEESKVFILQ